MAAGTCLQVGRRRERRAACRTRQPKMSHSVDQGPLHSHPPLRLKPFRRHARNARCSRAPNAETPDVRRRAQSTSAAPSQPTWTPDIGLVSVSCLGIGLTAAAELRDGPRNGSGHCSKRKAAP